MKMARTRKLKRPGTEPSFVPPMLAKLVRELPEGPDWSYEPKWDGYRIQAIKHNGTVRLLSRRGNDFTRRFPSVAKAVARVNASSAVLDGEVVAIDAKGRPSFQVLQNRSAVLPGWRLAFYAFDLLHLDGEDLKNLPLTTRRERLASILGASGVSFSLTLEGSAAVVTKVVTQHGLEGIVAKRNDSKYEPGKRNGAWQKLPLKPKQEFVIGGYRPGGVGVEILLVGVFDKGKFVFAGKVAQGLNRWNRARLLKLLTPLAVPKCPFTNLPSSKTGHWGEGVTADQMEEYVWLRPEVVAEIKFAEWTSGEVLRHAEFEAVRDDKEAKEVVRE